jgi:hypothetical protein
MRDNLLPMTETERETAPAARRAPPEPLLVLVHIPKTAGMTLARILHCHYGNALRGTGEPRGRHARPDQQAPNVFSRFEHVDGRLRAIAATSGVRAVVGHITFGLHDRLPTDARYVTILRDPIERTLSHYYFFVRPPAERGERAWAGLVPPWLQQPSPELTLEECLTEGGFIPDNLQTRMLCGLVSPYDPLPPSALEQAEHNLRKRFAFVGTTERLEEFLALLNLELGWPAVAGERSNANPGRLRKEDLAPEVLRVVEERNALDRQLHASAAELLAEALARRGPELELELDVLRGAGKLREARERGRGGDSLEVVRSLPVEAQIELAVKEAELAEAQFQVATLKNRLKWQRRKRRRRQAAPQS